MIIYGSKAKNLGSSMIPNAVCPSCKNRNTLGMVVLQPYAHVYWIPLFPMGKKAVAVCSHCQYEA